MDTEAKIAQKFKSNKSEFGQVNLKKTLIYYGPLFCILIGFFLTSLSVGPYMNGDTVKEYDAVSGILNKGLPIIAGGYLMDEPPVGFYIQAFFFKFFGASFDNGLSVILLFGLGCISLVYAIGTAAYNKTTGFFAALLFAFTPWHLILSRSFLIDVPCLFFSLLSLLVGLLAFRRQSIKLLVISGIVFAVAFNTKLYAVFILIPLLALFLKSKKYTFREALTWVVAFSIPVIVATLLWYQTITGVGLSAIYSHTDLTSLNPAVAAPTPFFATNFLISYGLGWFFLDAAALAFFVSLWQRHRFQKYLITDTIVLTTILCILLVNTLLGAALNLKAPYLNAIKYDYQSLPFFSLLAASLISKSLSLYNMSKIKEKAAKIPIAAVALLCVALVALALFYNMSYIHLFSTWDYLIFRVAPNINEGYSLFNPNPIGVNSLAMGLQFLGFISATLGILWFSKDKLKLTLKRIRAAI